jgi:putative oxidoreductase
MIPERYAPMTYALFRIVFGFLFFAFGTQKLFGWFGGRQMDLMTRLGAAGVIETVCGLLIMLGLFTRPAAFLASGEMAAAYFLAHLPQSTVPLVNMGERATMFCFAFLHMCSRGSGIWSLDALRGSSAKRL